MSKNKMNVILTGGTGTLGSQIIFELLKQENIKTIFLPVRQKNGKSALSRIKTILESAAAPEFISKNEGAISKRIKVTVGKKARSRKLEDRSRKEGHYQGSFSVKCSISDICIYNLNLKSETPNPEVRN